MTRRLACLALAIGVCGVASAAAQPLPSSGPSSGYSVKPSEVTVPEGETLGEFRRMIQPFRNWTLICDESLKSKHRVCNITQTIVNGQGGVAFNWSLVATAEGKPLMVMRVPAAAGAGQPIELSLSEKPDRIIAQTDRCEAGYCVATIAIGDMLRRHIRAGTVCEVSYQLADIGPVVLAAPLEGLYLALSRLK